MRTGRGICRLPALHERRDLVDLVAPSARCVYFLGSVLAPQYLQRVRTARNHETESHGQPARRGAAHLHQPSRHRYHARPAAAAETVERLFILPGNADDHPAPDKRHIFLDAAEKSDPRWSRGSVANASECEIAAWLGLRLPYDELRASRWISVESRKYPKPSVNGMAPKAAAIIASGS